VLFLPAGLVWCDGMGLIPEVVGLLFCLSKQNKQQQEGILTSVMAEK